MCVGRMTDLEALTVVADMRYRRDGARDEKRTGVTTWHVAGWRGSRPGIGWIIYSFLRYALRASIGARSRPDWAGAAAAADASARSSACQGQSRVTNIIRHPHRCTPVLFS